MATILCGVSTERLNFSGLIALDCLSSLLSAMYTHGADSVFCQYSVIILSNIACSSHKCRVLVADANGVEAVIAAMQRHAVRSKPRPTSLLCIMNCHKTGAESVHVDSFARQESLGLRRGGAR